MSDITQSQKTALLKIPGFKEIQKQYAKENKMTGAGKKRRMKGRGFWDDVGNWFNQAGKDINQFLKDTKIVSNIAAYALPILGAMGGSLLTVNPLGATAGGIAGKSAADYIRSQGYGYVDNLSKIGTKRTSGKGIKEFVKKHKLVSRGLEGLASIVPQGSDALNTQGAKNTLYRFANAAKMAGYGMKGGYSSEDALAIARGIAPGMGSMIGKGPVYSQNGMLVKQPRQSGGCGCGMKGGATTQYNTVSTEFSEVKFR